MAACETRPPGPTSFPCHGTSTSKPRRDSVDTLVELFEKRNQLIRTPSGPITRTGTVPSDLIRSRFNSFLNSRKQTFSAHSLRLPPARNTFNLQDLEKIDTALKAKRGGHLTSSLDRCEEVPASEIQVNACKLHLVKIIATPRSVTIHIPEGVQLPLTTTIESAGPFRTVLERPMSLGHSRGKSSLNSGSSLDEASERSRSRAASVQASNPDAVKESTEPQSPASDSRPKLREVRRGMFGISEASVPLPQSSPVLVEGEIVAHQLDYHHHIAKEEAQPGSGGSQENQPTIESSAEQQTTKDKDTAQELAPDTQLSTSNEANPVDTKGKRLDAPPTSAHQENHTDTQRQGQLSPEPTSVLPTIEIHRPSDTESTMVALGTNVINADTGSTYATPVPRGIAAAADAATSSTPNSNTLPVNPPASPTAVLNGVSAGIPADAPNAAVMDVSVHGASYSGIPPVWVPTLPVGEKVKRRKKVVRRARKVILKRRVLTIILGKELGATVYPLLSASGAAGIPVNPPVGAREGSV